MRIVAKGNLHTYMLGTDVNVVLVYLDSVNYEYMKSLGFFSHSFLMFVTKELNFLCVEIQL